jgi:hypothetical protein
MEDFAELMQRLLEIQSSGRQRSPELIAEDARLMDGLQKRSNAELGKNANGGISGFLANWANITNPSKP